MSKIYSEITFDKTKLKTGIDKISNAVKSTLGPNGKNVIVKAGFGTISTKDGVSVAKMINLEDSMESIGANLIKNVASKAADETGDGTTTATVLAQNIYEESLNFVDKKKNIRTLKKELELGLTKVTDKLEEYKKNIATDEEIKRVSYISANNDKDLGDVVANTFLAVNEDSPITIESNLIDDTSYKVIDGYKLDCGLAHKNLSADWRNNKLTQHKAMTMISTIPLNSLKQIENILVAAQKSQRAITLFVKQISDTALNDVIRNRLEAQLDVNVVKMVGTDNQIKEYCEDLSIITGGKYLDATLGHSYETITEDFIGSAKKVESNLKYSIVLNDEELYADEVASLKEKLKEEERDTKHAYDLEKLEKRINRLSCKVGVISVGGRNEMEQKEKQDRVDDALGAVRSARESGIIVGGGVALYKISKELEDKNSSDGEKIIYNAIKAPFRQILTNASLNTEYYEKMLEDKEFNYGVNVFNEKIEDLFENGVIDPVKVIKKSLESAVSVVGELLTTEVIIDIINKEEENVQ